MNELQMGESEKRYLKFVYKVANELEEVVTESNAKIASILDRYSLGSSTYSTIETVYDDETGELFQFDRAEAVQWDDPEMHPPFFQLYRLPNGRWILCWDKIEDDHVEMRFHEYTPEEATAWFLSNGICLPEELKHIGEAKRLDRQPHRWVERQNASYWQRFGPIQDDSSGDQNTLMYHPPDHWILFTKPSYRAAGNRHKPLMPDQAAKWLLDNGLEVPPILIPYLSAPDSPNDEQLLETQISPTKAESVEQGEPPNSTPQAREMPPTEEMMGSMAEDANQPVDDPTAFRPAKEFLDAERFPNYKAIRKVLQDNPWIRRDKPSRLRLKIHAGDWQKYLGQSKSILVDPLDLPAQTVLEVVQELERRKTDERNRKSGG